MIGTAEALVKWLFNQNREKLFEVKEHKEKRTLTQNAYMWSLINEIANKMKTRLADITPKMGTIKQSVIDQTKTVFTTPTLNIYAQDELTPAKMNSIIDTVNRRLGSKY